MRQKATYYISDVLSFKDKLTVWSSQFEQSAVLQGQSHSKNGLYLKYDMLVGVEAISELTVEENSFQALADYHNLNKDWLFGFLSYDLKNELEDLDSNNSDHLDFPNLHFFQPKWVFELVKNELNIYFPMSESRKKMQLLFKDIMQMEDVKNVSQKIEVKSRLSKEDYFKGFEHLKAHIQRGDIYEVNYCQEYYAENATLNPISVYQNLQHISTSPFSAFYRTNHRYLMCASPERFLKKMGEKLISQPIKGTRKRGKTVEEDNQLKEELFNCPKEQSENVMIVDLVRNDLSKTAAPFSVKVEELFGIYSFPQVHQMISTVVSDLKKDIHWTEALKQAFPMGSMTGAPKISAMQLIEKFETFKRGLYSGSVGYISPAGDFDFNVVIRSILYNSKNKYASISVGSAITALANPSDEYDECELKAKAMLEVLNA